MQQEEVQVSKFFDSEFLLFGKYPYKEKVDDISVAELMAINSSKSNIIVPHTSGRYQVKRFRKAQCPIIERLTNSLMYHGRNNGKKCLAIKIVKQALDIIALTTGKNPIKVVLDAISIAGPREDSTRIGSGGAVKKTGLKFAQNQDSEIDEFRSRLKEMEFDANEIQNLVNSSELSKAA
jgi:small subunit ribosomal protein S5e